MELDPHAVARELGFAGPIDNSIDAVSDRDFVAEFLFVAALVGVHLSRLGEEICLWASREFGWAAFSPESGVQSLPCQSMRCEGTGPSMPSHHTSPSSVRATLVKIELAFIVSMAIGFVS